MAIEAKDVQAGSKIIWAGDEIEPREPLIIVELLGDGWAVAKSMRQGKNYPRDPARAIELVGWFETWQ